MAAARRAEADNDERRAISLDRALQQIRNQFGAGAVMKLGQSYVYEGPPVIPTGSLRLDLAIGVGGFPRGRIVEIFGPESSGKTTLALHAMANTQKQGGTAAMIDAEHALDPVYARRLGLDLDTLLLSQPDSAEQALEICELLVRSNAVDMIVIDSVAALVPQAEVDGEMGDQHMGLQARLMSQALRKLASIVNKTCCCILFLNQIRMKIGVMFGNPETTPGGNALRFYSSLRLDIRRIGSIKQGDEVTGSQVRVKVVKNKVAPPFRTAEFDILFNEGISREGDLLELGVELGLLRRSGTWFSFGETRLGQGREQARLFLVEHPGVADAVEADILTRLVPDASEPTRSSTSRKPHGSLEEAEETSDTAWE